MNILFDCERMKYQYIGLFYYCLNLGSALEKLATASGDQLTYFTKLAIGRACFGKDKLFLNQQEIHKLFFPLRKDFDIWHCTDQRSPYSPSNRKLKKVLTIHDLNFIHEPGSDKNKIERNLRIVQRNIDKSDHLIAISEFVKQDILQHLSIKNIPISVVYNGCQLFPKRQPPQPDFIPESPFLFSIGTITDKKNFHVLPRLLVKNNYQLIIAGNITSKEYYNQIREEASRLGVAEKIIFTGEISENDKQWYYSHCKAFVFPSLAEGFGLPVIEAMSFGKPVFLSQATSLPEIGGNDAYYFDSFETEDMLDVLKKGMSDFESNEENKIELLKKRAAQFSWENCAGECLKIYRGLA